MTNMFVPGEALLNLFFLCISSCRKVTITGSLRSIRTAEAMINQKVASVTER